MTSCTFREGLSCHKREAWSHEANLFDTIVAIEAVWLQEKVFRCPVPGRVL
jgi:hypothetical protein